jgi:hypothetical protein
MKFYVRYGSKQELIMLLLAHSFQLLILFYDYEVPTLVHDANEKLHFSFSADFHSILKTKKR